MAHFIQHLPIVNIVLLYASLNLLLVGIKKETGYLYFVDKDGDISRALMQHKGRSKK